MTRAFFSISALALFLFSAVQQVSISSVAAAEQLPEEFKVAAKAKKSDDKKDNSSKTEDVKASETGAETGTDSAVNTPSIVHGSAANGGECIRPTSEMRKNHMDMILHKRDQTMHKGVRTKDSSLTQCISCHAVKGDDGEFVKATDPKHFCRGCHDYVAVRIDCFDCHNSRPNMKNAKAAGTQNDASLNPHKRLSPFALTKDHKATATALNSFLGDQAHDKK